MKETIIPFSVVMGLFLLILVVVGVWSYMKLSPTGTTSNDVLRQMQEQAANNSQFMTDTTASAAAQYEITPGLTAQDVSEGSGTPVIAGQTVAVKYTGMLADGTVFDSTDRQGGNPFTFTLGGQQVIKGWDMGVVGMRPGGVRMLVIAPELAYGDREIGGVIPANSTLTFKVEMIGPVQ